MTENAYLFPAFVQMLLQQVVSVNALCLPYAFHGLLVHFQAHRWHRVTSTAGKTVYLVFITLRCSIHSSSSTSSPMVWFFSKQDKKCYNFF